MAVCAVGLFLSWKVFVEIISQGILVFEYLGGENSGISLISPPTFCISPFAPQDLFAVSTFPHLPFAPQPQKTDVSSLQSCKVMTIAEPEGKRKRQHVIGFKD